MPGKGYDEFVGRAVNDAEFRKRLLKDPVGVIEAEGYEVPENVLEILANLDAEQVDAAIKAAEDKVGDKRAAT
ncbi:MAG: Os1348 family NHLP clan protein [Myxococcota bacterium]|jgi:hypothetical protein|nr:Os1348 family NHLP clan protein [Myxococcota bacterium]